MERRMRTHASFRESIKHILGSFYFEFTASPVEKLGKSLAQYKRDPVSAKRAIWLLTHEYDPRKVVITNAVFVTHLIEISKDEKATASLRAEAVEALRRLHSPQMVGVFEELF